MMRTILFDFDGTVADTLPLIFTAFRSTFQRFLQEHYTDEQIVALFGPTETGILQNRLPAHEHAAALDHFLPSTRSSMPGCKPRGNRPHAGAVARGWSPDGNRHGKRTEKRRYFLARVGTGNVFFRRDYRR